jgi:hypothetical protein
MLDFDLQRSSRRCAVTGRELLPGELFYSALVSEGGQVHRQDYAADAWQGAPPQTIGWWKSQVPTPESRKKTWAPSDVMLHYFTEAEGDPAREDLRYVLALLMTRRRIVRHESTETSDDGQQWLLLYCPRNEAQYRVKVVLPTEQRVQEIQRDLERLLVG